MKFRRTNKVGKFEVTKVKNKGAVSKNVVRVTISPRSPEAKRRLRTVSKSATFLATESVNSAPFKREERGAIFLQGKVQNSSPILRCTFFARKSTKMIANFSATKVTSLPSLSLSLSLSLSFSFSLSLSLSLSPHAPHAQYRKRSCASYNKHRGGSEEESILCPVYK